MVYYCKFEDCKRQSNFGEKNTSERLYCSKHKKLGHVNLSDQICQYIGCIRSASYGINDTNKRLFCVIHKDADKHVDLKHKKCQYIGCKSYPSYGIDKPLFCVKHKKSEHIDVVNKKCQYEGCNILPIFGVDGTNKALFCVDHKKSHHVDIKNKKCQYIGCKNRASYGLENSKECLFCFIHKENNNVILGQKTCQFEGCGVYPSFGLPKTTERLFCIKHKGLNHVSLNNNKCQYEDCKNNSYYGVVGTKEALFCNIHKDKNHVNVIQKLCHFTGCTVRSGFGPLFKPKTHCSTHKSHNEYSKNSPLCSECKNDAYYTNDGSNYPQRCEEHKLEDDVNIIEKPCSSCGLTFYLNENALCNDCNNFIYNKVHKVKEKNIGILLKANNYEIASHDKIIEGGCSKYRPDYVIDFGTHIVIIEVDENQHKSYSCECEQARMINIFQDFGGLPVCFVRYNPDTYKDNFGKSKRYSKSREKRLLDVLNGLKNHILSYKLSSMYLFFDGDDGQNKFVELDYENNNSIDIIV